MQRHAVLSTGSCRVLAIHACTLDLFPINCVVWTRGTEGHKIPDHSHSYKLYVEPLSCGLHQPYNNFMYTCLLQDEFPPSLSSVLGIQAVIQKCVQLSYTIFSTPIAMYRYLISQTTKVDTTGTAEHPEDSRSPQEPVGTERDSPSSKVNS